MHRQVKHRNRIIEGLVQKKPFQKDLIQDRHLTKKWDAYTRKEKKTKLR